MSTTLTIRTDRRLRAALEARARALGKSVSAVAREILETALEPRPLERRTGHLRGRYGWESHVPTHGGRRSASATGATEVPDRGYRARGGLSGRR